MIIDDCSSTTDITKNRYFDDRYFSTGRVEQQAYIELAEQSFTHLHALLVTNEDDRY